NDIYDYARRTAMTEYLASRGIVWLIDTGPIERHEETVRGGYDPATFVDHLATFKVFERPEVTPKKLFMWRYNARPSGSPG
ncbi:MAG: hypothetical protein HUU35_06865, partial [Armatimonadetes bacterium]|nr:hypothetical protein [Armatimonadota bacterium]